MKNQIPYLSEFQSRPEYQSLDTAGQDAFRAGYFDTLHENAEDENDYNRILKEKADDRIESVKSVYKQRYPQAKFDPQSLDPDKDSDIYIALDEIDSMYGELNANLNGKVGEAKSDDMEDPNRGLRYKPFSYNGSKGYSVMYPNGDMESIPNVDNPAKLSDFIKKNRADKFKGQREGWFDQMRQKGVEDGWMKPSAVFNELDGVTDKLENVDRGIQGDINALKKTVSNIKQGFQTLDIIGDADLLREDLHPTKKRLSEMSTVDKLGAYMSAGLGGTPSSVNFASEKMTPEARQAIKDRMLGKYKNLFDEIGASDKIKGTRSLNEFQKYMQTKAKEDRGSAGTFLEYFSNNPDEILPWSTSIMASAIPDVGAAIGLGLTTGGAGAGAYGGLREYSATLLTEIQEKAANENKQLTPELMATYLEDQKWLEDIKAKAATRALVIGGADAILGGGAAKIVEKFKTSLGRVVAGSSLGAATGGGGEALAQLITEGKFDIPEIAGEALGEVGAGPVTAGLGEAKDIVVDHFSKQSKTKLEADIAAQKLKTDANEEARKRTVVESLNEMEKGFVNRNKKEPAEQSTTPAFEGEVETPLTGEVQGALRGKTEEAFQGKTAEALKGQSIRPFSGEEVQGLTPDAPMPPPPTIQGEGETFTTAEAAPIKETQFAVKVDGVRDPIAITATSTEEASARAKEVFPDKEVTSVVAADPVAEAEAGAAPLTENTPAEEAAPAKDGDTTQTSFANTDDLLSQVDQRTKDGWKLKSSKSVTTNGTQVRTATWVKTGDSPATKQAEVKTPIQEAADAATTEVARLEDEVRRATVREKVIDFARKYAASKGEGKKGKLAGARKSMVNFLVGQGMSKADATSEAYAMQDGGNYDPEDAAEIEYHVNKVVDKLKGVPQSSTLTETPAKKPRKKKALPENTTEEFTPKELPKEEQIVEEVTEAEQVLEQAEQAGQDASYAKAKAKLGPAQLQEVASHITEQISLDYPKMSAQLRDVTINNGVAFFKAFPQWYAEMEALFLEVPQIYLADLYNRIATAYNKATDSSFSGSPIDLGPVVESSSILEPVNGETLGSYIDKVLAHPATSEVDRSVLTFLKLKTNKALLDGIHVRTGSIFDNSRYDQVDGILYMNPNSLKSPRIAVHEIIHGVTSDFIAIQGTKLSLHFNIQIHGSANGALMAFYKAMEPTVRAQLKKDGVVSADYLTAIEAYLSYLETLGVTKEKVEANDPSISMFGQYTPAANPLVESGQIHYGSVSLDEFFAEALSNPVFQMELSKLPPVNGNSRSLLSTVIKVMSRMLGIPFNKANLLFNVANNAAAIAKSKDNNQTWGQRFKDKNPPGWKPVVTPQIREERIQKASVIFKQLASLFDRINGLKFPGRASWGDIYPASNYNGSKELIELSNGQIDEETYNKAMTFIRKPDFAGGLRKNSNMTDSAIHSEMSAYDQMPASEITDDIADAYDLEIREQSKLSTVISQVDSSTSKAKELIQQLKDLGEPVFTDYTKYLSDIGSEIPPVSPESPYYKKDPNAKYEVYDSQTGNVVWEGQTREAARKVSDNRDNKYGGYRFKVRAKDSVNSEPTAAEFPGFHGTGADILNSEKGRMSLDYVRTGEGSQAFGHGHYIGQRKGTAEGYIPRNLLFNGEKFDPLNSSHDAAQYIRAEGSRDFAIARYKNDILDQEEKIAADEEAIKDPELPYSEIKHFSEWVAYGKELLDFMRQGLKHLENETEAKLTESTGNLYTVDVKPDESLFLDLDLPVTEQTPEIQEVLKQMMPSEFVNSYKGFTGHDAYKALSEHFRYNIPKSERAGMSFKEEKNEGDRLTSEWLYSKGIKGNKFFDRASRGNQVEENQKTRNFVIFHDDDVEITHANGEPVTKAEKTEAITQIDSDQDPQAPVPPQAPGDTWTGAGKNDEYLYKNAFEYEMPDGTKVSSEGMGINASVKQVAGVSYKTGEIDQITEAQAEAAKLDSQKETAASKMKDQIRKKRFEDMKREFPEILEGMEYDGKNTTEARDKVLAALNMEVPDNVTDEDGNTLTPERREKIKRLTENKLLMFPSLRDLIERPGITSNHASQLLEAVDYLMSKTEDPVNLTSRELTKYNQITESFSDEGAPIGFKYLVPKAFEEKWMAEYKYRGLTEEDFTMPIGDRRNGLFFGAVIDTTGRMASVAAEVDKMGRTEKGAQYLRDLMGHYKDQIDLKELEETTLNAEFANAIQKFTPKMQELSANRIGIVARLTQWKIGGSMTPMQYIESRHNQLIIGINDSMKMDAPDDAAVAKAAYDQIVGTTDITKLPDEKAVVTFLESQLTAGELAVLNTLRDIGQRHLPSLNFVKAITQNAVLDVWANYVHDSSSTPKEKTQGDTLSNLNQPQAILNTRTGITAERTYPVLDIRTVGTRQIREATYEKHTGVERHTLTEAIKVGGNISKMLDKGNRGKGKIRPISDRLRNVLQAYHNAMTQSANPMGEIGSLFEILVATGQGIAVVGPNAFARNRASSAVVKYMSIAALGENGLKNIFTYDAHRDVIRPFLAANFPTQYERTSQFDLTHKELEPYRLTEKWKASRAMKDGVFTAIRKLAPQLPRAAITLFNDEVLKHAGNLSNSGPEREAAFAIWTAHYIDSLIKKGVVSGTTDFIAKLPIDRRAATDASDYVSRMMGYAPDVAGKGAAWHGDTNLKKMTMRSFFAFMQQATGLATEFQTQATKAGNAYMSGDIVGGSKHIARAMIPLASTLTYRSMGAVLASSLFWSLTRFWKSNDDEEQKRFLAEAQAKNAATSQRDNLHRTGIDLVSTIFPVGSLGSVGNMLMDIGIDSTNVVASVDHGKLVFEHKEKLKKEAADMEERIKEVQRYRNQHERMGASTSVLAEYDEELHKLDLQKTELTDKINFKYFVNKPIDAFLSGYGGYGMFAEKSIDLIKEMVDADLNTEEKQELEKILSEEKYTYFDPIAGPGYSSGAIHNLASLAQNFFPSQWSKKKHEMHSPSVFFGAMFTPGQNPLPIIERGRREQAKDELKKRRKLQKQLDALKTRMTGGTLPEEAIDEAGLENVPDIE